MNIKLEDKFIFDGIKVEVAFIDAYGSIYLSPITDSGYYNNFPLLKGLVFVKVNNKGIELKTGKTISIIKPKRKK